MTVEEVGNIQIGLYLVYWKNGSVSKALIGLDSGGFRTISCHNWVGAGVRMHHYHNAIEKLIFII